MPFATAETNLLILFAANRERRRAGCSKTRCRDNLRTSMFCQEEGLNLNVRASIGVATYPHDAKTPREIIRQADEMMYLVKNTSRDNIGIASRGVMK